MPDIRHLVFIRTSPQKLYDALTTQKGIASWWSVQNNALPETGNIYRIYFGGDYYKEIKVTELIPNKKVTWNILNAHSEWLNTTVVFEISKKKDILELRFAHTNWENYTDMFAQCNHHWGIFLQNLKAYVESGKLFAMNEFGKDIPSS